ncbi:hypothetical protein [Streptomyces sp. H51]|uniref:hypothetical protein n=1 Tax=Streptomyces sp. H51 TaxID=3111770 RepID=UPI002D7838B3|nr:hypothetical protein [Streptomyces sp. H51]
MATTETSRTGRAPGALLLCRADADSVARTALLLGETMTLVRAGDGWSVLVPGGGPWAGGAETVDDVLTGWATALAVGAPWPVLALWWDADRAGYTLVSGFRRPVGYVWLADGTPAGQDEAMRTFAARLGLGPDLPSLDRLTTSDRWADARARLRGLLTVLTHAGVALPPGLDPGEPADRLREAARALPDARPVTGQAASAARRFEGTGRPLEREDRSHERADRSHEGADRPETALPALGAGTGPERRNARLPWAGTSKGQTLALAQLAAGLPLTAWGAYRRSGGWLAAGALLLAHGALGLARAPMRPLD